MDKKLDVYIGSGLVGQLVHEVSGQIVLQYAPSWLADPAAIPLSQSLPLRPEKYENAAYFTGILPDGDKRKTIAKLLGISAKNDFSMLEKLGGECAGAVTFAAEGEAPSAANDKYRQLSDAGLAELIGSLPRRPLLAGVEDIRLSLAGAQDKLAVRVASGRIFLPLAGAPSTHILKPAPAGFANMAANEHFCMTLAGKIGLPVSPTKLGRLGDIDYILIERYDRGPAPISRGGASLLRLHQEDFCQALGIVPSRKYQHEGGPSLADCFALVRGISSAPSKDLQALLDAAIFNFVIGNNDAHGKNFSLLYRLTAAGDLETRLAPFYDLLSTGFYPELSNRMAMKIGGEYDSARVFGRHFEKMAEEVGFSKRLVVRRVRELTGVIVEKLPELEHEHPVHRELAALIRERCSRTIRRIDNSSSDAGD